MKFYYTIKDTKLDFYQQKVNVRVASQFVKSLKTLAIRILGNFKKTPEMLGIEDEHPTNHKIEMY